jgi:hypothetical protein
MKYVLTYQHPSSAFRQLIIWRDHDISDKDWKYEFHLVLNGEKRGHYAAGWWIENYKIAESDSIEELTQLAALRMLDFN